MKAAGALPPELRAGFSKLDPQRRQKLCQLRQWRPRGLGHPFLLRLRLCGVHARRLALSVDSNKVVLGTAPLGDFKKTVASQITEALDNANPAENTVVALSGIGSLFGFLRVSEILPMVEPHIRGRLLVFFPGVYEHENYRLLDARDGWNYRAVPILAAEGDN